MMQLEDDGHEILLYNVQNINFNDFLLRHSSDLLSPHILAHMYQGFTITTMMIPNTIFLGFGKGFVFHYDNCTFHVAHRNIHLIPNNDTFQQGSIGYHRYLVFHEVSEKSELCILFDPRSSLGTNLPFGQQCHSTHMKFSSLNILA